MSAAKGSAAAALRDVVPTIRENLERGLDLSDLLVGPIVDDKPQTATQGKKQKGKSRGKK